jgi:hypothetical protein
VSSRFGTKSGLVTNFSIGTRTTRRFASSLILPYPTGSHQLAPDTDPYVPTLTLKVLPYFKHAISRIRSIAFRLRLIPSHQPGLRLVREVADQIRPLGIQLVSRKSQVASRSPVLWKRSEPPQEHRISIRELGECLHKNIARVTSVVQLPINSEANFGRLRRPNGGRGRARSRQRFCRHRG